MSTVVQCPSCGKRVNRFVNGETCPFCNTDIDAVDEDESERQPDSERVQ